MDILKGLLLIIIMPFLLKNCKPYKVEEITVIKNTSVFDGYKIMLNTDFVFCKDSIIEISNNSNIPRNATVIDGKGKTILPPFINAHVHVMDTINLYDAQKQGIFALLDMFSTDRRANYFRSVERRNLASFYSSNVGATVPGGHGTQFGIQIPTINNKKSPQEFIQDRINENADYIKITQEKTMNVLADSLLKTLIQEAKNNDLVTVAHISDFENAVKLSKFGVDGLAHIWYRKGDVNESITEFEKNNTFIIPTLSVIKRVIEIDSTNEIFLSYSEIERNLNSLHKRGVIILAGTDSPNLQLNYSSDYFKELELLHRAGLENIEVLRAATTNIYDSFRLEEFRYLAAGSVSSFILVNGNPHINIADIHHAKSVWKHGELLD